MLEEQLYVCSGGLMQPNKTLLGNATASVF